MITDYKEAHRVIVEECLRKLRKVARERYQEQKDVFDNIELLWLLNGAINQIKDVITLMEKKK